jgi:hypothetical protein
LKHIRPKNARVCCGREMHDSGLEIEGIYYWKCINCGIYKKERINDRDKNALDRKQ